MNIKKRAKVSTHPMLFPLKTKIVTGFYRENILFWGTLCCPARQIAHYAWMKPRRPARRDRESGHSPIPRLGMFLDYAFKRRDFPIPVRKAVEGESS
jgi:hypothetical protein